MSAESAPPSPLAWLLATVFGSISIIALKNKLIVLYQLLIHPILEYSLMLYATYYSQNYACIIDAYLILVNDTDIEKVY